jgi:hypothetical protein
MSFKNKKEDKEADQKPTSSFQRLTSVFTKTKTFSPLIKITDVEMIKDFEIIMPYMKKKFFIVYNKKDYIKNSFQRSETNEDNDLDEVGLYYPLFYNKRRNSYVVVNWNPMLAPSKNLLGEKFMLLRNTSHVTPLSIMIYQITDTDLDSVSDIDIEDYPVMKENERFKSEEQRKDIDLVIQNEHGVNIPFTWKEFKEQMETNTGLGKDLQEMLKALMLEDAKYIVHYFTKKMI